jgi:hypothetical protein
LPFFGEKIGVFLKNQCYDHIFAKTCSSLSKKREYFRQCFGENILKIITSVPGANPMYDRGLLCRRFKKTYIQHNKKHNAFLKQKIFFMKFFDRIDQTLPPGTDVMIFKIFSPKKSAEKSRF